MQTGCSIRVDWAIAIGKFRRGATPDLGFTPDSHLIYTVEPFGSGDGLSTHRGKIGDGCLRVLTRVRSGGDRPSPPEIRPLLIGRSFPTILGRRRRGQNTLGNPRWHRASGIADAPGVVKPDGFITGWVVADVVKIFSGPHKAVITD